MSADSDALKAIKPLNLSPEAEQYLLTVARGEGFYPIEAETARILSKKRWDSET